jgi:DNA-binding MarR family transcriptional regulator
MNSTERVAALDRVLELVVLLGEDMTRSLAADGLTTSRAHLLWELLHRGPTTQRVLAEALGVSARNVTGLVDALVETGFVTREPHPGDRRATQVCFTDRGARTAERMRAGHEELARILFEPMPPEQFQTFATGLDEVVARLRDRLLLEAGAHDPGPEVPA